MNEDIETLLRGAPAPAMRVSADDVIAGATRTRRRRRVNAASFGLAAALVIGVGVGATQLSTNRADPVPATQSDTAALGKFFKDTKVGEGRFNDIVVSAVGATFGVRSNDPKAPAYSQVGSLPGGGTIFRSRDHTVVMAPLPRGTDRASLIIASDSKLTGSTYGVGMRFSGGTPVGFFITAPTATPQAVRWNIGSEYYASTGERGQVASFPNARVYWYPKLQVFALDSDSPGITLEAAQGNPSTGYFTGGGGMGESAKQFFAAAVPIGSSDVSLLITNGSGSVQSRIPNPKIARLGSTNYQVAYQGRNNNSEFMALSGIEWTDSTGRHIKKFPLPV